MILLSEEKLHDQGKKMLNAFELVIKSYGLAQHRGQWHVTVVLVSNFQFCFSGGVPTVLFQIHRYVSG
jgi:hypothetical protein